MASSQGKNELKLADWMATLPESIHSIPLTNLAIPGRCPLPLAPPCFILHLVLTSPVPAGRMLIQGVGPWVFQILEDPGTGESR